MADDAGASRSELDKAQVPCPLVLRPRLLDRRYANSCVAIRSTHRPTLDAMMAFLAPGREGAECLDQ
jgi:hypothetical protein